MRYIVREKFFRLGEDSTIMNEAGQPILWWMMCRSPKVQKKYGGTVGVMAVGMFSKGAIWGNPIANRTQILLGSIVEKRGVRGWSHRHPGMSQSDHELEP